MANFTTRVELHKASTEQDYELLHKEMAKEGFNRTIHLSGEPTYHLPTAEYSIISEDLTSQQVLDRAKKAATQTKKTFMVLVTKSEERRYWYNLPKV